MAQAAPVFDRIRIIPRPDDFLDRNVGASGEIFFDLQSKSLRLLDGKERGGATVLTNKNVNKYLAQSGVAFIQKNITVARNSEDSANVYYPDGVENPQLTLVRGYTYVFDQSDTSNIYFPNQDQTLNIHPLLFSTTENGTLNDGESYTANVTYYIEDDPVTEEEYLEEFAAATIRKIAITPTTDTPDTLYYYCTRHLNMGNQINVSDPGGGGGGGNTTVVVSDSAPDDPQPGNIWFNSVNGKLYVYVADEDSNQWVQPASGANTFDAFKNINLADSTQFSAAGQDTISFLDGPGIQIDTDPATKSITISATGEQGDSIGNFVLSNGQITTDDSSAITFVPSVVMASDLTVQDTISAPNFEYNGLGTAVIESASTLSLVAPDGIKINNITQSSELIRVLTGATGIVDHNYNDASVYYHTTMVDDFTPNFENVPLDNDKIFTLVLILDQAATAFVPTSNIRVNGETVTPVSVGGLSLLGTSNGLDVISYTLIRQSDSWTALVSQTDYS